MTPERRERIAQRVITAFLFGIPVAILVFGIIVAITQTR